MPAPLSRGIRTCKLCGKQTLVAEALGVCGPCVRERPHAAAPYVQAAHARSRGRFGLPPSAPRAEGAPRCGGCANRCRPADGGTGLCGLRRNLDGKLARLAGTPDAGLLQSYHDPLPTNCVADWVCAGCTGAGYPRYARCPGPERGFDNLAVFYGACTFDCLFCQNWHFREMTVERATLVSAEELAARVGPATSCICYFGGDPAAQMPHAIRTSELALSRAPRTRICWETNGSAAWSQLRRAVGFSLESGGTVKFDIKAHDNGLHRALCGASSRQMLEHFRRAWRLACERDAPPPLVASTLLVPGYVDAREVDGIAEFISSLDPGIPYALLAFHPHYLMEDLPPTPLSLARDCMDAARRHLRAVKLGNVHLLW